MDDLMIFLKPLVLTVLFECGTAFLMGLRKKDLFLVLLVNVVTNPVLVLFCVIMMYHLGIGKAYLITYLVLEPMVVYVEYRFYRAFLKHETDVLRLSLLLNIASITGGILCQLL